MPLSIAVLTIFPEVIRSYMDLSIMKRAAAKGLVELDLKNLRDYARDRHRTVDDYPYGGGPGMVMKPEPFFEAVSEIKRDGRPTRTLLMSPQGARFDQKMAGELSREHRRLLFICGRYEGVDERVKALVDEEVSIGDYVLTGGELPALVIIDAAVRLLPGALGDEYSAVEESFSWGILDYPQYTRAPEWLGIRVPEVLLSGNHAQVARWRRKEALKRTLLKRPELLEEAGGELTEEDRKLVREIKEELER